MRGKQLHWFEENTFKLHARLEHGGELRQGRRKLARPIDPKRPVHLVLRSTRARGAWAMDLPKNAARVRRIVDAYARANDVRIYQYANVGNHLHLLVRSRTREGFKSFLRTIGALIARLITGAKKGSPKGKFWDFLAYTRVIEWGRGFRAARAYVLMNEMESAGVWSRRERRTGAWPRPG